MQRLTSPDSRNSQIVPSGSWGRPITLIALASCGVLLAGGCSGPCSAPPTGRQSTRDAIPAAEWTIAADPAAVRPPFAFGEDDDRFLDEIERASFWFLWNACDPESGMVFDRSSVTFVSTAGVGFQLAAIPAAVERGWVTREEGRTRVGRILKALESNPNNRKAGLFYHFLDGRTAAPKDNDAVSTIDSALLFAGMIVAGEYFGGEAAEIGQRLFAQADWSFFVLRDPRPDELYLRGFISLGWKPTNFADPTGPGSLLPYAWADAADEQRLVSFLAAAAPNAANRVSARQYYRLRRMLGEHGDSGVHVWFPWSGALFTHFFAHCFINYAGMGPDDPGAHGVVHRPRVDWWENARRGVRLHRIKAMENPPGLPGFGPNAWGLTASDAPRGYAVPGVFPERVRTSDQIAQYDYAEFVPRDDFGDGTIAPYGAGCSVMFEPAASIWALRHYRQVRVGAGGDSLWRDPGRAGETGEFGFRDSYNVGAGWVAPDYVAIDQGPLVLAIENARSGLIWRLFHRNASVRSGMRELGISLNKSPTGD